MTSLDNLDLNALTPAQVARINELLAVRVMGAVDWEIQEGVWEIDGSYYVNPLEGWDPEIPYWTPDTNLNQLAQVVRRLGEMCDANYPEACESFDNYLFNHQQGGNAFDNIIDELDNLWAACAQACLDAQIFTEAEILE